MNWKAILGIIIILALAVSAVLFFSSEEKPFSDGVVDLEMAVSSAGINLSAENAFDSIDYASVNTDLLESNLVSFKASVGGYENSPVLSAATDVYLAFAELVSYNKQISEDFAQSPAESVDNCGEEVLAYMKGLETASNQQFQKYSLLAQKIDSFNESHSENSSSFNFNNIYPDLQFLQEKNSEVSDSVALWESFCALTPESVGE